MGEEASDLMTLEIGSPGVGLKGVEVPFETRRIPPVPDLFVRCEIRCRDEPGGCRSYLYSSSS